MVTIKRKVEINLPQFIAWAVDNHITGSFYANNRANAKIIRFEFGRIVSSHGDLRSHDTFTVEVEEEITEDTVLDEMLLVYDNGVTHIAENKNLSFISKGNLKSAYYMNDDLRLILIWRDGELIKE